MADSHNPEQDTFHRQSMCSQKHLRFQISLTEIFSKLFPHRVMKNVIKALSCRFQKCFGPFKMLTLKGSSETAIFRECSKQVFESL